MKRLFALLLATACLFGLVACGGNTETPAGTTAQPTETTAPKVEKDDGVLRVLMIGHSLGNDAMWMQPAVFRNEAPDMKVVIGFLYYSGCKLSAHVEYVQQTAPVYGYMEYDSEKGDYWYKADSMGNMNPHVYGSSVSGADPNSGISQTSLFAIKRQDWDIVVTQGYPWEVAKVKSTSYDPDLLGNFNKLKQFVLDNDIDKETTPKFGWNMVWTFPDDDELIRDNDRATMNANFEKVEDYYDVTAQIVRDELVPQLGLNYVFPSSTAYINALSGYKTTKEMYRDYAHASDFGRVMIAYLWYCNLTGTNIEDCEFAPINYQYQKEELQYMLKEDLVISDEDKAVIIEVVGNALKNPYEITPKA